MGKTESKNSNSLLRLTEPPYMQLSKIGDSLDFPRIRSHNHALKIAWSAWKKLKEEDKSALIEAILAVFEQWKKEHGTPRKKGLSVGLMWPFDTYESKENLSEERLLEISALKPWECCAYVRTPVGLFFKLLAEEYQPLDSFVKTWKPSKDKEKIGWISSYVYILATLILLSSDPDSDQQSGEFIEAALKLAEVRIDIQDSRIKDMEPAERAVWNRKRQAKIKRDAVVQEKERCILELHKKYVSEESIPPYKEYAQTLGKGYSVATISRFLQNNGLSKRSKS